MHTEIKDLHHALDHTTADLHAAESTSHDEWNTRDLAETMLKDLEQRIKNDQLCATALASCASGHPLRKMCQCMRQPTPLVQIALGRFAKPLQ